MNNGSGPMGSNGMVFADSSDYCLEGGDVAGNNIRHLDRPGATFEDGGDSSQLRWALRQIRLLTMKLATANLLKDKVLAEVSHELRNPLAAIRGAAYLLGRQDAGPAVQQRGKH